jgi:3-hydroxyacyl-CoA dehydrogenase
MASMPICNSMDGIPTNVERVLVVGVGWVGRQIAARMAQHGLQVWLYDREPEICQQALAWARSISSEPIDSTSPASAEDSLWTDNLQIAESLIVTSVQLVVESVPEQISLKKRILKELSQAFPYPVILASNSSYFTPSVLGRFVDSPQRYAHFHFHFPVLRQTVCDIVGGEATAPAVLDCLAALATRIGQPALRLKREHPGYVYNWLLQSLLRSALELVAKDVVDPQEVDRSWKAVTGMPLGPFGIMDLIGLDVIEQVLSNARWADAPEVGLDQLIEVLATHINHGHLGVKSQRGFYDYPSS